MAQPGFERENFKQEGDNVKHDAFAAVFALHGTTITDEAFAELVLEAFAVYGYVVRAQILEQISVYLKEEKLTEERIDQTIIFLAKRLDGAAARLGDMLMLVEETKTPGARH